MGSAFDTFRKLGPASFVLKAIISVIVVDVLLLAFILLRRTYRKWHFANRDARMLAIRQQWDALISGEIPYAAWRSRTSERELIETMVLDAFEVANPEESARLLKFMRGSGLIEKRIWEARHHQGWRRHRALVALARTRAPEGIRALAEGLRDRDSETRLAALRGLGRMACPEAAKEILNWVDDLGLVVPALPLQSALIQSCAERPQVLLPHLQHADRTIREVLGRVLGEVATPSLGPELLRFADDDLPELRAAAARGLLYLNPGDAITVLSELAKDAVWFVRLRAIVSLGGFCHPTAIPSLLHGLTDSNRLVRLRAAEGLVDFKTQLLPIFEKVVVLRDQYGLHAFLTALENAGLQVTLVAAINNTTGRKSETNDILLEVLRTGKVSAHAKAFEENILVKAASHS
ncbi:MAG TPA: HEAT repeat domain-containing protein [Candidatus Acidoferrum sp.]|nr:HEAT repeat domain-containing protein [Candidatus Acidoferrum sp.]